MKKSKMTLSKCFVSVGVVALSVNASYNHAAKCDYILQNEWNNGFVAAIRITNDTSAVVNGWDVNWTYTGDNRVINSWNATISGSNPYTASALASNATIQPGQSAEFGFLGSKGAAAAEVPQVTGNVCSTTTPEPTTGTFRVDQTGNITKNGELLPVRCGAWFGLEGRHEPSDDANNPSGAPMELYMGNTFWANGGQGTGRTIQQTIDEIKAKGINVVRLPIAPQTLDRNDPQGLPAVFKNHPSVRASSARQALEDFIVLAAQNDVNVIIDIHSCSNYVGWRAGRLDATPPYVDATRENYDFKRENYACGPAGPGVTVHQYNEAMWLDDLREIAGLSEKLGVGNILGIDIFNEPWDYTWQQWKTLAENAYQAINAINEDVLIVVEGVAAETSDGVKVPHGDEASNPNWGENFFEQGTNPLNIPKERLVLSPHTYGPSVFVQRQFMDPAQPACQGLEGDAAGDAKCNLVIDAAKLRAGWDEHFGYLREQGFAIVVGEFGGNLDWPAGTTPIRDRDRWGYLAPGFDSEWQNIFVDYMVEKNIQACYWSINPESGDTAGWYGHEYDPISNTEGWGEWRDFDIRKTTLLNRLWGN